MRAHADQNPDNFRLDKELPFPGTAFKGQMARGIWTPNPCGLL